jgi:hypothetical protein
MAEVNPAVLASIARELKALGLKHAFVGGSITALLLDNTSLSPVRATDDVDVIVEVLTTQRYSDVEAALRSAGFDHDTREAAPLCRWIWRGLTVDIMPVDGAFLGLNTAWFPEALASATIRVFGEARLPIISPVAFLATKLAAFADRGDGDFYASHDLEDLITVIDGRSAIVDEVGSAPASLRKYVIETLRAMNDSPEFREALPGHLPSDAASQQRLRSLRQKIAAIGAIRA